MIWANRNGNFYVLDRETGKFSRRQAFVKVNWMDTFDERGRPNQTPQPAGQPTWPGNQGGTNWYSPSYSPHTGLFYVSAVGRLRDDLRRTLSSIRRTELRRRRESIVRPVPGAPAVPGVRRGPINNWTGSGRHRCRARARCGHGELKWKFPMTDVTDSGILTTASDVLFTGGREGYFSGTRRHGRIALWKASLGAQIVSGPITYETDGKQYVTAISACRSASSELRD